MNNRTQSIQTDRPRTPSTLLLSVARMAGALKVLTVGVLLLWAPVTSFALSTSPASLTFSGTVGTTNPPAQTVTFWKGGDRTKNWVVSASTAWISATPFSGTIAKEQDQITVSVNTTDLSAGSYTASVIISTESFNGRMTNTSIPVSRSVAGSSTTTPTIRLTPIALNFSGTAGGANPAARLLNLSSPTGGTLS